MAKTTILRVEKGTVLTAEMRKNLKSLLGDFETREYIKTPDLKKIYQRRIDILAEAFEFIYNSITPSSCTSAELAAYLQFCKQLNQLPDIADQDKYQEILTNFTGMLVNALIDNWNWPYRVRDAVGLLNKAEQYVIMQKGRQNLATLSTVSQLKDSFVLNWENTLPSCSKQTIDELIKIKQTYLSDLPNWLEQLPYYQQVFFLTSPETCTTVTQLNSENNDIIDLWRSKTLSNDDYIAIIDGYSIDGTKKKKPDWYRELPGNRKQILRSLLISEGNNKEKVEQKLNDLTKKLCEKSDEATAALIKKIRGLPSWFVKLPLSEQKLLKAALDKSENVADVVHFLPSRLRTIPGLANLAEHNCAILDTNCNVKKQFGPKLRSSHLASRDVKSQPEPIGQLHARRNYAQILEIAKTRYEKYSILIQTLISPVPGAEVVDVPDEYLDRMREWVIQNNSSHGFTVYTKNHPYNVAKRFIWTGASDPDCLALLAAAKAVTPKKPALEKLIRSYEATLNSGFLTTNLRDYTGRELSLSSYEHLLVEHIGGVSYGSCVSGKDRKALEIIHSDAMQIYYEIYNEWPQFNEFNKDKRGNFVDIVSDLYVTRHAHEFADENAPGTEGIKTPENYYPADIAAAIQKKMDPFKNSLACDDKNATNNEVKKIAKFKQGSSKYVPDGNKNHLIFNGYSSCLIAAQRLSSEQQKKLLNEIRTLTGETDFWKEKRYAVGKNIPFFNRTKYVNAMPGGIDFMYKATGRQDNLTRILAEIYFNLENRPDDPNRDPVTLDVYNAILDLRKANPADNVYQNSLDSIIKVRNMAFEANRLIPVC